MFRSKRNPNILSPADQGQSLVLFALMLPVLLGLVGLALDFGYVASQHRALQNAADAAALAGAQDLSANYQLATGDATTFLSANGYTGTGNDTTPTIALSQKFVANDTISVSLKRSVPLNFMFVLGVGSLNVTAGAKATASGITSCDTTLGACFPYIVWNQHFNASCINNQPGDIVIFHDNSYAGVTGASSCGWNGNSNNFKGFLRPDAPLVLGDNTTKGGNACGQEPDANLRKSFDNDQPIILPVVDTESGNGANLDIHVIGFVALSLNFTYPYPGQSQTIAITGAPTGGSFTLSFKGTGSTTYTTTPLLYNDTAADVKSALAALPSIGSAANIDVIGANGGPYFVTFQGTLANLSLPAITTASSLTGGASPAVTVTVPYNADPELAGTASKASDYTCPNRFDGKLLSYTASAPGATLGSVGGTSQCGATLKGCVVKLVNYP